jgi:hypothetical protein
VRVLHAGVHPEPARGRERVRGVAAQKRAPDAEAVRHERGHRPLANAPNANVGRVERRTSRGGVDRVTLRRTFGEVRRGSGDEIGALREGEIPREGLRRGEEGDLRDELALAAKVVRDDRPRRRRG